MRVTQQLWQYEVTGANGNNGLTQTGLADHYIGLCRIRRITPRHSQWRLMLGGGENTSSSPGPGCHHKLLNLWWILHHQRVMYRDGLHNRWSLPATPLVVNDFTSWCLGNLSGSSCEGSAVASKRDVIPVSSRDYRWHWRLSRRMRWLAETNGPNCENWPDVVAD